MRGPGRRGSDGWTSGGSLSGLRASLQLREEKVGPPPDLFELRQGGRTLARLDDPHDLRCREDRILEGGLVDVATARPLLPEKGSAGVAQGLERLIPIDGDEKLKPQRRRVAETRGLRLRNRRMRPFRDLDEADFRHWDAK